ncbi:MAG: EAL domain-containing protein [Planctomycetota bacterium]
MNTISPELFDPPSHSQATSGDVWFLCGPTQAGETVVNSPVDANPFVIGRKNGVSLKLQYSTVSGQHAQAWGESGKLFLKDLGSTNGTYVNGVRLDGGQTIEINAEDLIHFAEAPFRVRRQSPTSLSNGTIAQNVCDQALALVQFDRLMNERLINPHFQSIINIRTGATIGFEILGRGSVFGLESVGAMFQAAEQLNLEVELSRLLRWEGIRVGRELEDRPTLFVNTHPRELRDIYGLITSMQKVREMTGETDLVLEIHESSVTNASIMADLHAAMGDLKVRLAYDDFGSGQARLSELIEASPHYVKFDISLIRGLDTASEARVQMLKTLVKMVRDLDIYALAEGIETMGEAQACRDLGFQLAQGYHFGRPTPLGQLSS